MYVGTVVYDKLCAALTNNVLVKGIKRVNQESLSLAQTSCLEGFHSVLNHFVPKMIGYSYIGMYRRYKKNYLIFCLFFVKPIFSYYYFFGLMSILWKNIHQWHNMAWNYFCPTVFSWSVFMPRWTWIGLFSYIDGLLKHFSYKLPEHMQLICKFAIG